MEFILLSFFGILSGILAGIFGIGGGTLIVPAMLLTGVSIKHAVGISIMQMMFSSIYGSILNIKSKLLDFKIAFFISIGGAFGASFSGFIIHNTNEMWLKMAFSCICIYSLLKVVMDFKNNSKKVNLRGKITANIVLFLIGFLTGIFAISLGIGGGLIIIPLVSYYLGIPTKNVVPISLFFIIFSSISGFSSLMIYDYIDYNKGLVVGISSLLGVHIGTKINSKLSIRVHKIALIILYSIILSFMIYNIFK